MKTPFTGDPAADALLTDNPFALLLGMLLDQQVTMEFAFRAPAMLAARLDGALEPATLDGLGADKVEALFRDKPALHRYPGSMGKRAYALSAFLVEHYDGRAENFWAGVSSGDELLERLLALPGFGTEKARIFVGVLGKRMGVQPAGWEAVAADWPSIADVSSYERLAEVRDAKRAMKAAKKRAVS